MAKCFNSWWLIALVVSCIFVCGDSAADNNNDNNSEGVKTPSGVAEELNSIKDLRSTDWKSLKRSKYLTYLFRKYGSGGLITFEVSAPQVD